MTRLESSLTAVISRQYPQVAERLADGATFGEAGVDSLGVVEFLLTLQRAFDIRFNGDELDINADVSDVIELLTAKGVTGPTEEG